MQDVINALNNWSDAQMKKRQSEQMTLGALIGCMDAVLPCVGLRVGLGQHRRPCFVLGFFLFIHLDFWSWKNTGLFLVQKFVQNHFKNVKSSLDLLHSLLSNGQTRTTQRN